MLVAERCYNRIRKWSCFCSKYVGTIESQQWIFVSLGADLDEERFQIVRVEADKCFCAECVILCAVVKGETKEAKRGTCETAKTFLSAGHKI